MTIKKQPSRRKIREKVLQALYAYEISKDDPTYIFNTLLSDTSVQNITKNFADSLFFDVIKNYDSFNNSIKILSKHWREDRIAVIDKILLRMGMCELIYFGEIPAKVTLNEIIELAKQYSTEKSPQFINGILNAFYQEEIKSGRIVKHGRGLL
ncbi:MAG: transcription antitermination factor NusB [Bacteroidetes bacterium]|nr:transcription antitermination factor NusB [Bacteroidota bacterium]